jgi:C-terminal processing protease CtpA/Prc
MELGDLLLAPRRVASGTIGANLRWRGGLRLGALFPEGPAMQAGLLEDDEVVAIDGVTVASLAEAGPRLRGPPGSVVVVTALRNGVAVPFQVVRAP